MPLNNKKKTPSREKTAKKMRIMQQKENEDRKLKKIKKKAKWKVGLSWKNKSKSIK